MESIPKVDHITQRFGGLVALSDINMEIGKGEIIGIIGPNGAGKTTLFNIVTGIYSPTEGNIFLAGQDITGQKPHRITAMGFARTFQNIRLFPKMTVLDNVILGMHTRTKSNLFDAVLRLPRQHAEEKRNRERAFEILKLLDLYDVRYNMSTALPYGSQRKLEIARALASEPKLLLDEPAAGMNATETEDLMNIVRKLKSMGYTISLSKK